MQTSFVVILLFALGCTRCHSIEPKSSPISSQLQELLPYSYEITSSERTMPKRSTQIHKQPANESAQPDNNENKFDHQQKFRVNVSNVCERNHMRVTIRFNRPFHGLIHTKDKRRKTACQVEGNGEQSYSMDISFTQVQSEPTYCGVVANHNQALATRHLVGSGANQSVAPGQQQQTLSVVLVVRLHRSIEFSDDRYFLISCNNRCARPDCSSAINQEARTAWPFSGFLASESILSPVIKSAEQSSNKSGRNRLSQELIQHSGWPSERCDSILDLKFQWLVRLCYILSILLLLSFCALLYLCYTCSRSRRNQRAASARTDLGAGKSTKDSKKNLYLSKQAENMSWSAATATTLTDASNPSSAESAGAGLDHLRQHDAYLLKQHQHIMANLMLAQTNTGNNQQAALESQHQQVDVPVLGRSVGTFVGSGLQRRQLEAARIRRCRSIGSTMSRVQFSSDDDRHKKQREKSLSQTTIHYEQGQDPFKAVPFNYLTNNGYQSDSTTSISRLYTGSDAQSQYHDQTNQIAASSGDADLPLKSQLAVPSSETMSHSLPPEVQMIANNRQHQKPRWQTNIVPSQTQMINKFAGHQPQLDQVCSQFDPQNSRQLIDLIQQKHRQQIAQANRTVASLQQNGAEGFCNSQMMHPALINQRHSSSTTKQQLRPWM